MSSNPEIPIPRPAQPITLDANLATAGPGSASLWDRISAWAAEHKAVVYTIAGVTVLVTGAGAVYYFSGDAGKKAESAKSKKNKKQKERKRARQAAEEAAAKESDQTGTRPLTESLRGAQQANCRASHQEALRR